MQPCAPTTALLARLQAKRSFLLTITEKEMTNSGALERVPTRQGSEIPGRVINLDQAVARHGDKADYMVRMLSVGDPLADAVVVKRKRNQYRARIKRGLLCVYFQQ
jgi:hypothetical protein